MEENGQKTERHNPKSVRGIIYLVVIVVIIAAVLFLTLMGHSGKYWRYTVNYRGETFTVETDGAEADALAELGIAADAVEYESRITDDRAVEIDVFDRCMVSVACDGEIRFTELRSGAEAADALAALEITVDDDDRVSPALTTAVTDGMEITVTRIEIEYTDVDLPIEHEVSRVANDTLYKGTENVVTKGEDGVKKLIYKSVMADDVLESFDLDEEKIDKEPVTEVIEYGTKVKEEPKKTETKKTDTKKKDTKKTDTKKTETKTSTDPEKNEQSTKPNAKASYTSGKSNNYHDDGNGTVTTYSGKQLKYSKVVELKATAYTYSSNKKYNTTASGAPVQVGIVAANKNTLKMGTKVYIVSDYGTWEYGVATVGDTGCGAGKVDLFMESYDECIQFGVRAAKVYILE